MYLDYVTDDQLKEFILPGMTNFSRVKNNGRVYLEYSYENHKNLQTVLEDFAVIDSSVYIDEKEFRKFMFNLFKFKGYKEACCYYIKHTKQTEASNEIAHLGF